MNNQSKKENKLIADSSKHKKAIDNKYFSNNQKYAKEPDLFNLVYTDAPGNGDEA